MTAVESTLNRGFAESAILETSLRAPVAAIGEDSLARSEASDLRMREWVAAFRARMAAREKLQTRKIATSIRAVEVKLVD